MVVDRFDGLYGRAYDAIVGSPRGIGMAGRVFGRATALGEIPYLVRGAYSACPDEPLLDVPCGAASSLVHGHVVHRDAGVVGLDLSERMLERGRARVRELLPSFEVELVHGDALDLPFADGAFGSALSINGLHCMPDRARFASELARVVRPGGSLTLTTLVDAGGPGSRLANGVLRRGGVLPAPPPTLEAVTTLLADAGWSRVEHLSGTALVALACVR